MTFTFCNNTRNIPNQRVPYEFEVADQKLREYGWDPKSLPFPTLWERQGTEMLECWGNLPAPMTVLIDPEGKVKAVDEVGEVLAILARELGYEEAKNLR